MRATPDKILHGHPVEFRIHDGPIVTVTIGPSSVSLDRVATVPEDRVGASFAAAVGVESLINTGNYPTFVDARILAYTLKLEPQETFQFRTPAGVFVSDVYHVRLSLDGIDYDDFVIASDLEDYPCKCLLGRRFLERLRFMYDGPKHELIYSGP